VPMQEQRQWQQQEFESSEEQQHLSQPCTKVAVVSHPQQLLVTQHSLVWCSQFRCHTPPRRVMLEQCPWL
jgi:hypothetical protein